MKQVVKKYKKISKIQNQNQKKYTKSKEYP